MFTWEYYCLMASLGGNEKRLERDHSSKSISMRFGHVHCAEAGLTCILNVPASNLGVNRGLLVEGFTHRIEPTQSDDTK